MKVVAGFSLRFKQGVIKEMNIKQNSKSFYIRLVVTIASIILVMYLAKIWFFDTPKNGSSITVTNTISTPVKENIVPKVAQTILWQDADKHYGEYVTVKGQIVRTHNSGKVCFLNFHPDYKRHLTLVIFASAFGSFPANPEKYYKDKEVVVTGNIKEYNGQPEIILNTPDQIKVVK